VIAGQVVALSLGADPKDVEAVGALALMEVSGWRPMTC
jgi:hypothetical protein